jgi:hypothetical protein
VEGARLVSASDGSTDASATDPSQLADESASLALGTEAVSLFRLAVPMMLGQAIVAEGGRVIKCAPPSERAQSKLLALV